MVLNLKLISYVSMSITYGKSFHFPFPYFVTFIFLSMEGLLDNFLLLSVTFFSNYHYIVCPLAIFRNHECKAVKLQYIENTKVRKKVKTPHRKKERDLYMKNTNRRAYGKLIKRLQHKTEVPVNQKSMNICERTFVRIHSRSFD